MMLKLYDYDESRFVTLEELANALRPLLAQPEQPAAAADATAHDLRVARGERDWVRNARESVVHIADALREQLAAANRQLDKATANLQQVDAAKQRAELQLADTRLAKDTAQAAWGEARQEIDALRARLRVCTDTLDTVIRERDELREQVATLTQERDEARRSSDATYRAWNVVTEQRNAAGAALAVLKTERDELAAKWAGVPWAALGYWMPRTGDSMARDWFNANRPATSD